MKKRGTGEWIVIWRRIALFSCLCALAAAWIAFDALFDPLDRSGSVSVRIPDFCGSMIAGLEFEEWMRVETEYRYAPGVAAGTVISQTPLAGSRCRLTGEEQTCDILLAVSLGEEYLTLPDTVGEDVRVMIAELRGAGASVRTEWVEDPMHTAGTVLSMYPQAGERLPRGGDVVLTVSTGERTDTVTVPELSGLSGEEAAIRLWMSGLKVGNVTGEHSPRTEGTVLSQSHPAGIRVRTGTAISFTVSRS